MKKLLSRLIVVAAVCLPPIVQATIITTTSGLLTFNQSIDFSSPSLAPNTVVTNQYAPQGITFAGTGGGSLWANVCGIGAFNSVIGFSGDYIANTLCSSTPLDTSFSMMFDRNISEASIGIFSSRGNQINIFTALLNGVIVDTFVHDANTDTDATGVNNFILNRYLTFSSIVFNEIRFTDSNTDTQGFLVFDNVAFVNAATVSEPSSISLLLFGIFGYAGLRRKSANKSLRIKKGEARLN